MTTDQEKDFSQPSRRRDVLSLPVAGAFGFGVMIPALLWGLPTGADLDNHFRFVLPLYDEIGRGNFFPGWLAESNNGFGDPRFRFYPPALYYLLALFRFLTGDWYSASLAVFTLLSVVGTVGIYCWVRQNLSNGTALVAALLFAAAPYHLTQFYQASLLAEFAATSLLPYVFLFLERVTAPDSENAARRLGNAAGLAAFYSLSITTHLPTAVIGSFTFALYGLLLIDWKQIRRPLFYCVLGVGLALLSSSWFWVSMVSELSWIEAGGQVSSPYYDYRRNFLFSPFSQTNLNTFYGNLIAALTIGILLPSVIIWRRILGQRGENRLTVHFTGPENKIRRRLAAALVTALVSLLMTTDLSRPVWAVVPKLESIQFPYRWLSVTAVLVCPLAALSLAVWREKFRRRNIRPLHLPLVLMLPLTILFSVYDIVLDGESISRRDFLHRLEEIRGARSFRDWLPRGASELEDLEPLAGEVDAGERAVSVQEWSSHRRVFTLADGPAAAVRLRSYFYPLWQAFATRDGEKIRLDVFPAADGTLLVRVPAAPVTVEVVFSEPQKTKISRLTGALGWTIIFSLLILGIINFKKFSPDKNFID